MHRIALRKRGTAGKEAWLEGDHANCSVFSRPLEQQLDGSLAQHAQQSQVMQPKAVCALKAAVQGAAHLAPVCWA